MWNITIEIISGKPVTIFNNDKDNADKFNFLFVSIDLSEERYIYTYFFKDMSLCD